MGHAEDRLPPRTIPIVYFAFAHLSLACAFLLIALEPETHAAFFFDSRVLTVVHLFTLGWITSTTIGATYIVGPLALRMPLKTNWFDVMACISYLVGASGVIAHFWLNVGAVEPKYWGLASSGAFVLPAVIAIALRTWRALTGAGAPLPVKLHIAFGYFNLIVGATVGILVAANREVAFLPADQLHSAFAHAHLAAVGWATLMVAGIGYRLFSMIFPAAPPPDRPVWISLVLLETGVLGLFVALFHGKSWAPFFAAVVGAGVVWFLTTVVHMRVVNPRPPPVKLLRPDFGVFHVAQALFYLLVATVAGLFVVFTDGWALPWIWIYGICGLVGFLSQVIIGIEMRLLPMFAWVEGFAVSGYKEMPPNQYGMPWRELQAVSLVLWTAGVPMVALGFALEMPRMAGYGAWALFAGAVAAIVNGIRVLRHAFPSPAAPNS